MTTTAWPEVPLAEVLSEAKSGFACGEDPTEGVFQFRMNNLRSDGQLDFSKKRRVPSDSKKLDSYLLVPGDVLFNATNSPDLVGKSAFFAGHSEPAVFSNHFIRIRTDSEHLDGRFLARWLQLQFDLRIFKSRCKQWVNQATFGRDALLGLKIPLPSIVEQRRIAAVLDRADEIRANRRAALTLLDTLAESIFLDLFGDPGTNPHALAVKPLKELASQITDGEHQTPERTSHGVKLLSARNVRDGYLNFATVDFVSPEVHARLSRRCNPTSGDILISCSGTIGRVARIETDEPLSLVRSVALVRPIPSLVCPSYLEHYLRTTTIRHSMVRRANSSSQANLFQGQIKEIPVLLPDMGAQLEFEARAKRLAAATGIHKISAGRLDDLFASLQQRAFRGEL